MTSLAPLDRLADLLRRAADGHPIAIAEGAWACACLNRYLDLGAGADSLESAFNLNLNSGRSARHERAVRRRNEIIRTMAAECWPRTSVGARARNIAQEATRYAATRWKIDCTVSVIEAAHMPAPRRFLFLALKTGLGVPGARQIRRILAPSKVTHGGVPMSRHVGDHAGGTKKGPIADVTRKENRPAA